MLRSFFFKPSEKQVKVVAGAITIAGQASIMAIVNHSTKQSNLDNKVAHSAHEEELRNHYPFPFK